MHLVRLLPRPRSLLRPPRARPAPRGRRRRPGDERGDVPGWVLVTLMTVSIGMALWGIAQPQLVGILRDALASVR
ncbi:hypothetical protein GCM10022237_11040 [Nocardioides ginsengisoli]